MGRWDWRGAETIGVLERISWRPAEPRESGARDTPVDPMAVYIRISDVCQTRSRRRQAKARPLLL
jgi:hypothetical protein